MTAFLVITGIIFALFAYMCIADVVHGIRWGGTVDVLATTLSVCVIIMLVWNIFLLAGLLDIGHLNISINIST